jgi:erythromycin esterase
MKHMKQEQTKKHPVRWILLALLAVAVVAGGVFSHFGGFGTGKCADTDEFAKYAGTVQDISVPEQARVIALGEATHRQPGVPAA